MANAETPETAHFNELRRMAIPVEAYEFLPRAAEAVAAELEVPGLGERVRNLIGASDTPYPSLRVWEELRRNDDLAMGRVMEVAGVLYNEQNRSRWAAIIKDHDRLIPVLKAAGRGFNLFGVDISWLPKAGTIGSLRERLEPYAKS